MPTESQSAASGNRPESPLSAAAEPVFDPPVANGERATVEFREWMDPIFADETPRSDPPLPRSVDGARPQRIQMSNWLDEALDLTEFLPTDTVGNIPPFPHPFRHLLRAIAWSARLAFGIVSLVFLLALIAAIPVVNLLALGYLLEAEGRLARTGRLRFLFPLLDLAPRIGSIALGVWLWMWPLRLLSDAAADARVIDPAGPLAAGLSRLTSILTLAVAAHVCLALARGGSLGCFFRPLKNALWLFGRLRDRSYWQTAEKNVREYVLGLRLKHHFWLGLRGFVGAAIWIWPTTALFAVLRRSDHPGQILVTLLGGLLLVLVFAWVPFLQARFAAENRFRAMFELGEVRRLFRRAPIAWLVAVVVVYVLALPLYLFKAAAPPQDAMWLMTLVFIPTIYPAKIVTGWAYHRAWKHPAPRMLASQWGSRLAMVPLLGAYVFFLFFTQYIAAHGRAALFEQHAFLLPSPF